MHLPKKKRANFLKTEIRFSFLLEHESIESYTSFPFN